MNLLRNADQRRLFLATAIATRTQQRFAVAVAIGALLAFALAVPLARIPLVRMPAFIPSYEAALFFIDLITAILLFEQFVRLRSVALLVLASGYLFDAMIIIPHALSFPGAFTPTGLLGAGPQTTAWLYVFWHGGFPLFVMAYAWLSRREDSGAVQAVANPSWAITLSVAGTAALAIACAVLATVGHDILPVVMQGGNYSLLVTKGVSPAVWVLTLIAILMLWQRPLRVVDLWLMLVMWIWLFDIALSAVIGSSRFDLGFYAGRIFGLIAASFLLVTLLVEMAKLYTGALGAVANAEQRFAELARARSRAQADPKSLVHEKPGTFIVRQNIAHYRELLAAGSLDETQRRLTEKLLAEEEAKLAAKKS
jgi:hypothetical protein